MSDPLFLQAVSSLSASDNRYEAAVEWLCLNLDNAQLPPGFGGAKQAKMVVVGGNSNDPGNENSIYFRERARRLQAYCFPDDAIREALIETRADETTALHSLLQSLYPVDAFEYDKVPDDIRGDGKENVIEQARQQVEEEMMALEAIFQPEEYTKVSDTIIRFSAKLDRVAGVSECELLIPRTEDSIYYPFHPIYVAFKNSYVSEIPLQNPLPR